MHIAVLVELEDAFAIAEEIGIKAAGNDGVLKTALHEHLNDEGLELDLAGDFGEAHGRLVQFGACFNFSDALDVTGGASHGGAVGLLCLRIGLL